MSRNKTSNFAERLVVWQHMHGRHDLPWQGADAYRVWLSEIMLQQTQVTTVIPYYQRFLKSFPSVSALAAASEEQVLAHWSGLGYYARGRNLHRAAQLMVKNHHGEFPTELNSIIALPGIGRSTAAAICSLAFHQRCAILDGNVKRLLSRYCGVAGWTGDKKIEAQLWQQAETLLPQQNVAAFIQAQMDMGAMVCKRSKPKCTECPVNEDCVAYQTQRVNELPSPRPRKAIPEKNSTFLLLMSGREIFLEKRAPQGIWGGLWCPPQLEDGQEGVADYLLHNHIVVNERINLAELTHTFTHFKLHITPVLLRVAKKSLRAQQSGCVWQDVDEALTGAIPTPVRELLRQVASFMSSQQ